MTDLLPWLQNGALAVLLAAATIWDCREGRIPNWLTALGGAAGLLLCAVAWTTADSSVVVRAFCGAAVGGGALLFVFLGGGVGGGDVKLMAAAGLLAGYPAVVQHLFYGMLAALALILGRMAWQGGVPAALRGAWTVATTRPTAPASGDQGRPSVSFALALTVGVGWVWLMSVL